MQYLRLSGPCADAERKLQEQIEAEAKEKRVEHLCGMILCAKNHEEGPNAWVDNVARDVGGLGSPQEDAATRCRSIKNPELSHAFRLIKNDWLEARRLSVKKRSGSRMHRWSSVLWASS